jgi:hypothetical protein
MLLLLVDDALLIVFIGNDELIIVFDTHRRNTR